MGKSQETFGKKEKEKKRLKKKKDKEERKEERKSNPKASSLEEMMAYVDENGNLSSTPIDPTKKKVINVEDIQIGVGKQIEIDKDEVRTGVVSFFNEAKGYGFIKDSSNGESIFVHINGIKSPIKENDKVTFKVEMGLKGLNAVSVTKI